MKDKKYTLGEEIFSSVSHGAGALLAAAALPLMVVYSALNGDAYCIAAAVIYGVTLIILYLSSTLYHAITHERAKYVFRILDHASIFLLIAGTYTPYTLVSLKGALGWTIFAVIWSVAIIGVVLNSIDLKKFRIASVICYLLMGWAIIFAIKPLVASMPGSGILLLMLGGIVYTVGVVFYILKKYRYTHSIWHLFVLGGSILHFFSIFFYVF